jgi:hypothetical protein
MGKAKVPRRLLSKLLAGFTRCVLVRLSSPGGDYVSAVDCSSLSAWVVGAQENGFRRPFIWIAVAVRFLVLR